MIIIALDIESEFDRTIGAKIRASAISGILHGIHGFVGGQGNQSDSMRQELVTQNGGIGFQLNPIDGHDGRLGDHDPPDGIGHAQIGVFQLEFNQFVRQFYKIIYIGSRKEN